MNQPPPNPNAPAKLKERMPERGSFGVMCSIAIQRSAHDARARGEKFTYPEIAQIIDRLDAARPSLESTASPKSANPSPFGNRKAIPPTPEQVTAYSASIGYPMDGQKWCDQYGAKGWIVGKTKMKDWQCAVRNWKTNGWGLGTLTLEGANKNEDKTNYERF